MAQVVKQCRGFTTAKVVLLALANLDNPAKKAHITETVLEIMEQFGRNQDPYYIDKSVSKRLKELGNRQQVKKESRGIYSITERGIIALRKLDIDHGIPDNLKPHGLHNYKSPSLDSNEKKRKMVRT